MENIINLYKKNKEVINYLIFGFLTTGINFFAYFILTSTLLDASNSLELQVANIIAWIVAVIFAYMTNRKYVFDSKSKNKTRELISFFMARLVTLVIDMVIMYLGVNILIFNDKLVKIISQVIVILGNYVLSKIFVFKKSNK